MAPLHWRWRMAVAAEIQTSRMKDLRQTAEAEVARVELLKILLQKLKQASPTSKFAQLMKQTGIEGVQQELDARQAVIKCLENQIRDDQEAMAVDSLFGNGVGPAPQAKVASTR